jgi:pimeloyl-ACP methyl ester carboxylesterase
LQDLADDNAQFLAKLSCPVLFLRGETRLGAVMREGEFSWLRQNCGNVQCAPIDGVGHLLHLEGPGQAQVLAAMVAFLEAI